MKFIKNTKYYQGIVYEWNLPTGSSCPYALDCKVTVDRETGKFKNESTEYRCYASSPERFPAVREHRWKNYDHVLKNEKPILPNDCKAVRIHASGDFFNQSYFDMWLEICRENENIEFWAYTKSLKFWVNRLNEIPNNLELTASRGGRQDELIDQYDLKNVVIFRRLEDVPEGFPIDYNDNCARNKQIRQFGLLDNFGKERKQKKKELFPILN
jgi:hypothetical protein